VSGDGPQQHLANRQDRIQALHRELAHTNHGLLALILETELRLDERAKELHAVYAELEKTNSEILKFTLALQASQENLQAVFDTAHEAIVSADASGIITQWNAGAERIFGYAAGQIVGQLLTVLIPEMFPAGQVEGWERYGTAGAARVHGETVEMAGRRADGTQFPLELSLASWHTSEGTFFTGIMRDITARKQAEQALRAANKELEAFSYSLSHDLRGPLRQISASASILGDEYGPRLDAEARRYLGLISSGVKQMAQLIDDLLRLSRLDRQQLRQESTDLRKLVEEAISGLEMECAGRQIEWRVSPLPNVECDSGLTKQVFANLLSNAVKYTRTRERALIEVGHLMEEGKPVIFVRDNGVGFDMKHAGKLFGVFERLHDHSEFEGTGVGLATAQRIIHRQGGRIWAEAEPGKGATFFFSLGES
jgi:PAS domain S-box-containing protein